LESGKIPLYTLENLRRGLTARGFEFRTLTPLREINAALMNLSGITRHPKDGHYMAENWKELAVQAKGEEVPFEQEEVPFDQ
jgi:hypothetical protein